MASVINHISEIFAYFFSFKLITQMGHVKVLCLGLAGNVVRFLYIAWLSNPWWVLPFEFVQGVTHAAVWAACCSYIAHGAPAGLRSSAQGVLQGLHHGLGRGCGAVLGGAAVARWGTTRTFAGYGLLCALALAAFAFVNLRGEQDAPPAPELVPQPGLLAPHGVPSAPLPRALSSSRLHDLPASDYGATHAVSARSTADAVPLAPGPRSLCVSLPQAGDSLGVQGAPAPAPRPVNPFLADAGVR